MNKIKFVAEGRNVLMLESSALEQLATRLDSAFENACELLLACSGRVVVVGMGKSGHVGGKIAATLASTGTPSFFVHPGEASHGDLGMITPGDLVIAISNSGETPEILTILPIIKRMANPLIAMTGHPDSTLGRAAEVYLDTGVEREACPHNLAPTTSTTATLAMGDALAVAVLKSKGFSPEDFARSHPGGILGRRLLVYVGDIMHTDDDMPLIHRNASLSATLDEMSSKGLGMAGVLDDCGCLVGIYTDGDLRRSLNQGIDIQRSTIAEVMVTEPRTTTVDTLAAEVVEMMQLHSINGLFAVDDENRPLGALNTLDLIRAGIF